MREKVKTYSTLISCLFLFICLTGPAFASIINKEAQAYREKGFQAQSKKDFTSAIIYYQKAVELDPYYAVAYNDLGVVYETMGWLDRAEEAYIKCINLEPRFLPAYYNLGVLYDKKGSLKKAAYYYMRRIQLSPFLDPWTVKARDRLYEIAEELPEVKQVLLELEAQDLNRQVVETRAMKKPNEKDVQYHIDRGNMYYRQYDYLSALKEYSFAVQLDPRNKEADRLLKKAQRRVLVK